MKHIQYIIHVIEYQVIIGGDAARTLHLKIATFPSWTVHLCGLRTNLGIASRRSGKDRTDFKSTTKKLDAGLNRFAIIQNNHKIT